MMKAVETLKNFKGRLDKGLKGLKTITGRDAFKLYDTFGFPVEITMEMARERGLRVDEEGFDERFRQHQLKKPGGGGAALQGRPGGQRRADHQAAHRHPPASGSPPEGAGG